MNLIAADYPFIKRFSTSEHHYIYDLNTNEIVKVDQVVFSIIDDIHRLRDIDLRKKWGGTYGEAAVDRACLEVREVRAKDSLLFSFTRPTTIRPYGGIDIVATAAEFSLQHLILNVTDVCNLRCRYCVYSGKYPQRRSHSSRKMSRRVAEKAMNFFFEKSAYVAEPHIGFFGGEPLTNFDLIRYCVEYTETRQPGRYSFSLTTNGTLLSDQKCDYLVEHDFLLRISLDGPQELHDRLRVDRLGHGTWHTVMENLERFHNRYSYYVETRVGILTIAVSPEAMTAVQEFFQQHPWLSRVSLSASYPNYTPIPLSPEIGPVPPHKPRAESSDLFQRCEEELLARGVLTPFMHSHFAVELVRLHCRKRENGFEHGIHINGCCFPGHRRLFVDSAGTFFVCERLDDGYPIGSVDYGLNVKDMCTLIDDYEKLCEPCLNCWAVRFCPQCFASSFSSGHLDLAVREQDCESYRHRLEQIFELYHRVLEKKPDAFTFLSNIKLN